MTKTLFDLNEGMRRQKEGIDKVVANGADWLETARNKAVTIIDRRGYVTSDDIHAECEPPPWLHPNTMGAVFKDPRFRPDGYQRSRRPSAHGRIIRRYVRKT